MPGRTNRFSPEDGRADALGRLCVVFRFYRADFTNEACQGSVLPFCCLDGRPIDGLRWGGAVRVYLVFICFRFFVRVCNVPIFSVTCPYFFPYFFPPVYGTLFYSNNQSMSDSFLVAIWECLWLTCLCLTTPALATSLTAAVVPFARAVCRLCSNVRSSSSPMIALIPLLILVYMPFSLYHQTDFFFAVSAVLRIITSINLITIHWRHFVFTAARTRRWRDPVIAAPRTVIPRPFRTAPPLGDKLLVIGVSLSPKREWGSKRLKTHAAARGAPNFF